LPATFDRSAELPGTGVDVSPTPGTATADPHTQISFMGAPVSEISVISVVGSSSGPHSGSLQPYSQGDGASFLPASPFVAGEHVTVAATVAGKPVTFSFGVDTPYPTAGVHSFANPVAPPSDYQTFVTMPGVQAPVLNVTTADQDPSAGDIFTSNGPGPGRYGPLIYSPTGRLIWFSQFHGSQVADDVNVQTYQGQPDLTLWEGRVLSWGFGQGEDLVLNSHYQTVATVTGGNGLQADLHDFQIAANNVAYITAYNPISCNLASQQGPRNGVLLDGVVEAIDMKTGLVRWEWHSLDHVAASESETSPPASGPWDFFHLNSLDPEPNGDILISARNTWAGYQIQGGSGLILWRLGGLKSSFRMGPGTKTYWQHDGRVLPNGDVTFFDDGSDPPEEAQSRAVTISLNLTSHTASLARSLTHPNFPLLSASQGNAQALPYNNTFVAYGGEPYMTEFSRSGRLLFDAHMGVDMIFYRAYRHPWSGQPLTPPAVAASLNNTGEETLVHMSWNGATAVSAWRVLAGATPTSLAPQQTIAVSGFETSTVLPRQFATKTHPGYVAVQALDSSGHVLATSPTIAVQTYAHADPQ